MNQRDAWDRIVSWMSVTAPETLRRLHPGASEERIAEAEARLNVRLPDDYRRWVAGHDGADENGAATEELLSLASCVDTWNFECELFPEGVAQQIPMRADPGVRAVWWSERWIPFTSAPPSRCAQAFSYAT